MPLDFLDAESANKALDDCRDRVATLEIGLRAATYLCHLRQAGFCYVNCRAMVLCDAEGMTILTWGALPVEFRYLIQPHDAPVGRSQ